MAVPGYATFQENKQILDTYTIGHKQAGGSGIVIQRMFLWAFLRPLVVVEYITKGADYLEIIADQLHPYVGGICILQQYALFYQDNTLLSYNAGIMPQSFEKHADEFQSMPRSPNLQDLKSMQHVLGVTEWQFRNYFLFYTTGMN